MRSEEHSTLEGVIFDPYWRVIQEKISAFKTQKMHYHALLDTEWKNINLDDETKKRYKAIENNYAQAIKLLEQIKRPLSHLLFSIKLASDEAGEEANNLKGLQGATALAERFKAMINQLNPNAGMARELIEFSDCITVSISLLVTDIAKASEIDGAINNPQRIKALLAGVGFALLACVVSIFKIIFRPIRPIINNVFGEPDDYEKKGDYGISYQTTLSTFFINSFASFKAAWTGQKEPSRMKRLERELNQLLKTLNKGYSQIQDVMTADDPALIVHEGTLFLMVRKSKIFLLMAGFTMGFNLQAPLI